MKKYKAGLVVGRFQPFHLGHKFLVEEALKICETLIIGIGSSNIIDNQNPYSYEKREKFLKAFIKDAGIEKKVVKIIPIEDDPDDDIWFQKLIASAGKFDVGVGDNEWVNGIFENFGVAVVRVGLYMRETLEGTKIRTLLDKKLEVSDRIPSYIKQLINN